MTQWTRVSDKLPETDDVYIVTYIGRDYSKLDPDATALYVTTGQFFIKGNVWRIGGEYGEKVTHWMEFPKPPEGK